jgi:hypothetical protein
MSLSDVNQLALAILSGAGRRRTTLLIKTEQKYARRHANNATSLCTGVAASWVTSADQVTPCRAARIDEQAARANWPRLQAALRASVADTPRAERHGRAPDGTGTPRGVAASTGTRHGRVPAERMRRDTPRAAALGPSRTAQATGAAPGAGGRASAEPAQGPRAALGAMDAGAGTASGRHGHATPRAGRADARRERGGSPASPSRASRAGPRRKRRAATGASRAGGAGEPRRSRA